MVGLVWFLLHVPLQTRSSLWGTHMGKVWVLEMGASISFHLPRTAWSVSTRPTRPWADHREGLCAEHPPGMSAEPHQ